MIIEVLERQIGFIWFSFYSSEILWVDSIILDPEFQGKKYGTQIFHHLFNLFKSDFTYLDLGVQEQNTRAIQFYNRLGFYQIDDIAMGYYLTKRMRKKLID